MARHRFPERITLERGEAIELVGTLSDAAEVVNMTDLVGLSLDLQRQIERLTERLAGHWPEGGHSLER